METEITKSRIIIGFSFGIIMLMFPIFCLIFLKVQTNMDALCLSMFGVLSGFVLGETSKLDEERMRQLKNIETPQEKLLKEMQEVIDKHK